MHTFTAIIKPKFILLGSDFMKFDSEKLKLYRQIASDEKIFTAYGEFLKMFSEIYKKLSLDMPDFKFSAYSAENAMEYSYFQFADKEMKNKKLKYVIYLPHDSFAVHLMVCGQNKGVMRQYLSKNFALPEGAVKGREDKGDMHIFEFVLESDITDGDADKAVQEIKSAAEKAGEVIKNF